MEFDDGCLRLVHIRQVAGRPVLTHAVSAAVEVGASAEELAGVLRRTLEEKGIEATQVAVCLSAKSGFVRCEEPADRPVPAKPVSEGLITGQWQTQRQGVGVVVKGTADRQEAGRLVATARLAGLHVVGVVLSQVAVAAALGMLDRAAAEHPLAGFVIENARVRFTLAESHALLACRSAPRAGGQAEGAGQLDRYLDAVNKATQIYRAVQLDGLGAAAAFTIIADGRDEQVVAGLASRFGVPVERIGPGQPAGLTAQADGVDLSDYTVAIGGVLVASGLTERRMDLLGPLTRVQVDRPLIRRRMLVSLMIAVLLVVGGILAVRLIDKRIELADLERGHEAVGPLIKRQKAQRLTWDRIRPWLSADQGGLRAQHSRTLESIAELFPLDEAYVDYMYMGIDASDRDKGIKVELRGGATSSEVFNAFIARLTSSGKFNPTPGAIIDQQKYEGYPKDYSVTMLVKAEQDARKAK